MQASGCGPADRFPVKDYYLMRFVKNAMKSTTTGDASTEKINSDNNDSGNPASSRKLITVFSKK
jgi:hypothetical protein